MFTSLSNIYFSHEEIEILRLLQLFSKLTNKKKQLVADQEQEHTQRIKTPDVIACSLHWEGAHIRSKQLSYTTERTMGPCLCCCRLFSTEDVDMDSTHGTALCKTWMQTCNSWLAAVLGVTFQIIVGLSLKSPTKNIVWYKTRERRSLVSGDGNLDQLKQWD